MKWIIDFITSHHITSHHITSHHINPAFQSGGAVQKDLDPSQTIKDIRNDDGPLTWGLFEVVCIIKCYGFLLKLAQIVE